MEAMTYNVLFWFVMTVLGGGFTLPVFPGSEDPVIAAVAPEKCVAYVSWTGATKPDPKSLNQLEQLVAEPDFQRFLIECGEGINRIALNGRAADREVRDTLELMRIVAQHPAAAFISEIRREQGKPTQYRGGLVVALGNDADKLRWVVEWLEHSAQANAHEQGRIVQFGGQDWYRLQFGHDVAVITLGIRQNILVIGIGEGMAEGIVQRFGKKPPEWLSVVRQRLPVARVSSVAYIDFKALAGSMILPSPVVLKARLAINSLGLENVATISSVSGLEGEGFVSKVMVVTNGEQRGLLSLLSDKPLSPVDLQPIPYDASMSLALRFDSQQAMNLLLAVLEKTDPPTHLALRQTFDDIERSGGVNIRHEMLKHIGDVWCIYTSPGEGNLMLTGLTAVVPLKDATAFRASYDKLLDVLRRKLKEISTPGAVAQPQHCRYADHEIYYMAAAALSMSCCVTDHELIVSLYPPNIKAYLSREKNRTGLSRRIQVQRVLEASNSPGALVYLDSVKLFEFVYPMAMMTAAHCTDAGYSPVGMLPPAPVISRHLTPCTATLRRAEGRIELVIRQPVPGAGMLFALAGLSEILGKLDLGR